MNNIMPILSRATSVLLIMHLISGCAMHSGAPTKSTIDDYNQQKIEIIGRLGLPLGVPTEIHGVVLDGADLRDSMPASGVFFFSIESIDGVPISAVPPMAFKIPFRSLDLVPDYQALIRRKTLAGQNMASEDQQFLDIKRAYVGQRFKVIAYEAGEIASAPRKFPENIDYTWTSRNAFFHTYLVVLDAQRLGGAIDPSGNKSDSR